MFDIAPDLISALGRGERVAVAVMTGIGGSAPRTVGAAMALDSSGGVVGSISGGCVEGAAVALCDQVLEDGVPQRARFGFSDTDAFAAGLSCGGELDVVVRTLDPADEGIAEQLALAADGKAAAMAMVVEGPEGVLGTVLTATGGSAGSALTPDDVRRIRAELAARLRMGSSGAATVTCQAGELEVLCLVSTPPPRMIIFGAVDFSAALADAATLLGFHVTVCDARSLFATRARFPSADQVIARWPHEYLAEQSAAGLIDNRTVLCVLTHDAKFDIPLLTSALGLPVAYVGAMGSRRTHEQRMGLLIEAGVPQGQLDRLHSPIGLDLGASTPQETAISILAEVIASRTNASGAHLSGMSGTIHAATPGPAPARPESSDLPFLLNSGSGPACGPAGA